MNKVANKLVYGTILALGLGLSYYAGLCNGKETQRETDASQLEKIIHNRQTENKQDDYFRLEESEKSICDSMVNEELVKAKYQILNGANK
jgi:hypothetical protein